MDWQSVGVLAESISAFGVIISLIYLARQIKESSESNKASRRDSVLRQQFEWTCAVATSATGSYVCIKGCKDYSSLTEEERAQFIFVMFSMTKMCENIFLHYHDGLIDKEVWIRNKAMLKSYINQPGGRIYVQSRMEAYDPRFQKILQDMDANEKVEPAYNLVERNKGTQQV